MEKPIEHWKNLSLEDIEGEIWFDVLKYEGMYKWSNMGRIKSLKRNVYRSNGVLHYTKKEQILKQRLNEFGYPKISLTINSHTKFFKTHRIIAWSYFIGFPLSHEINHINGIKYCNELSNLECVSRSENLKHSYKFLGRKNPCSGKFGKEHHKSIPVVQLSKALELINEFESTSEAILKTGITGINGVCRGRRTLAKGFRWMYKEDYDKIKMV